MRTTYYSVQILDDGFPKKIPHTKGSKNCEFLDRKKAVEFFNKLIEKNPNEKFRILKRTEEYKADKWMQNKTHKTK